MKRIYQTIFTPPLGNCFPACVASLLELDLAEVPHPTEEDDSEWQSYWLRFKDWAKEIGWQYIEFEYTPGGWVPLGECILTGNSPRGEYKHTVVGEGLRIIHDPYPSVMKEKTETEVLLSILYVGLFIPLKVKGN